MSKEGNAKILIAAGLYPPDVGGPATYAKIIAEGLEEKGMDVQVLSFSELKKLPKGVKHLVYLWKLLGKGRGADTILALDPVSVGLPTYLASFFLRKPFCVRVSGDYAWEQGVQRYGVTKSLDDFQESKTGSASVSILKHTQRKVADGANIVITPSEYLKRIVEKWGVKSSKIEVVHSVVSSPPDLPGKRELREELNLAHNEEIISSAGRLVPWKGFPALLDSFTEMLKEKSNLKLFIFGSGPEEGQLKKQINEMGISSNAFMFGALPREELFKYLKVSDVFVLNTGYEGLSHQLLEVLHLGVPVVTTKVGGNLELIKNYETGLLVSYNDKKGIKDSVLKILNEPDFAKKMSDNGVETAKQFNKDEMLTKLTRIIQKEL